ncbi:hypothetical protein BKG69_01115 [Mycobacteroides chelonae]|nr:hypothetical protein BKG69_01115 [Mycobacteroides chelonae]
MLNGVTCVEDPSWRRSAGFDRNPAVARRVAGQVNQYYSACAAFGFVDDGKSIPLVASEVVAVKG